MLNQKATTSKQSIINITHFTLIHALINKYDNKNYTKMPKLFELNNGAAHWN